MTEDALGAVLDEMAEAQVGPSRRGGEMADEETAFPARCPWCGGCALVRQYTDGTCVKCMKCRASGPISNLGESVAVRVWNKMASRVAEPMLRDVEGAENAPSRTGDGAKWSESDIEGAKSQIRREPTETVDSPAWYTSGGVETIEKVEAVVAGLPSVPAYLLGQVVRYVDRAGMKDEAAIDLGKANNYAHRLVRGKWRDHE